MDNTANKNEKKKRVFSGVQPSGILTLGNYLGALKNWEPLINENECIFCVVDMHAITVTQLPADLRKHTLETAAMYIACGMDPEKCILFVQSHVHEHAELAWILNCFTMYGELSRMTQFKDKSKKHTDNINAGLFTYPVLMAADILLYNADYVPVGEDQRQHLELSRDIAERFNREKGDTFVVPEGLISKGGARIMSLASPDKKMSKSDENENGFIALTDSKDVIIKKFKRAVTDSDSEIRMSDSKPGISNLITIYSCATGKTVEETEKEFSGKGYGDFKAAVGEATADMLAPIQDRYNKLLNDKAYLESVIKTGAESASYIARRTMSKVRRKVGFIDCK